MRWSRALTSSLGASSPGTGRTMSFAAREGFVALALEPAAQRFGGQAVVAVVHGNTLTGLVGDGVDVTQFERQFEVAPRDGGVAQVQPPLEAVQRFQLLQAVTLHADAKGLAHHGVQVHEASAAQQLIEFGAARGVACHQSLERRGFVGAEVVDMRARVLLHARQCEVDEGLQGGLLLSGAAVPTAG